MLSIDVALFEWINSGLSNAFFDWLMPILRNKNTWLPLYIILVIALPIIFKKQGLIMVLAAIITVGLTDLTSNYGFKKNFQRLRPCKAELSVPVVERVPCGSGYSFTSNHAANHFALATFLWLLFRRKGRWVGPLVFIWAGSIAFAQVYVGLHYPFDILGGAILGILIATIVFRVFQKYTGMTAGV